MDKKRFDEKYFLTEDQKMVRDLAREFAQKEIMPVVEQLDNHDYELGYDLLRKTAELGFLGIAMPEEYGGMGLDSICQMLMMEEISKASASFGAVMQAHSGLGLYAILAGGTEEQKEKWLAPAMQVKNYVHLR